jgi:hypothetical protein
VGIRPGARSFTHTNRIESRTMKRIALFLLFTLAALGVHAQTFLVGDNTQVSTATALGGNTGGSATASLYTATGNGSAAIGWAYIGTAGDPFVLAVYNSSNTLLATSTAISSSTVGWNQFTFSSPTTIASGTQYRILLLDSSSVFFTQGTGASGSWQYQSSGITYPTPPNPFTSSGTGSASVQFSMYLTTSAGGGKVASQFFLSQ